MVGDLQISPAYLTLWGPSTLWCPLFPQPGNPALAWTPSAPGLRPPMPPSPPPSPAQLLPMFTPCPVAPSGWTNYGGQDTPVAWLHRLLNLGSL